ncbi:MAG: hypothetical protein KZQ66_02470, partial [Candidatus Thiodiazotropha sp. (ex Lucinoma aequizonata)]|nr:hypothetical protein [Candidatus Thiodiazotropha sp. (ex Lucinoma aequizonata)]
LHLLLALYSYLLSDTIVALIVALNNLLPRISLSSIKMGRVRNAYTAREKLAVIKYAEAHGNRAAGREFSVGESSVRDWRRMKDRLAKLPKTKQAERGSKAHFPEVEVQLLEWITDRRRQGIAVATIEIRLQAKMIANRLQQTAFKVSVNWVYAFLKRHSLSIRRRTHIAQKLPEDYDDKLLEFQRFIINERKMYNYDLSQIGNADQTPLTFDLPYATTVDVKGAKSVSINTTGNEKNRFTVMLACTADGGKLPPYVIFKRKTLPKVTWPKGVIVRVQDKGWMDDALTKDWIKCVWARRPGGLSKKSLLVLDSFRCHKSQDNKDLLREFKTRLAIIPGGMTSMLQPLDVSINKPMKVLLQRRWNMWYASGTHSFTKGGRMRKPELEEICQWISDAWEELDPKLIIHSFKKCCISNALDGTDDDILWQDQPTHEVPSADDAEVDANDFYSETPWIMTDEKFNKFFEDSDVDEEFEGFGEDEIRGF